MNDLLNQTLSQIVTDNYKAAGVFENYGLDFCCKGKRTLYYACIEKQVPVDALMEELSKAIQPGDDAADFSRMSLTELVEYIVRVHHSFVRTNMPQTLQYVSRVATKHGDLFPFMKEVYSLFTELAEEMNKHMAKEEKMLFPKIKLLELNASENTNENYLRQPIGVLKHEHDHAGTIMQKISALTGNFTAPAPACTTFGLALNSLKAFEIDLHQHVHLENNILFPKALRLFTKTADVYRAR